MNLINITSGLAGMLGGILFMYLYYKKARRNQKEILNRFDALMVKNMNLTDELAKIRAELAETGNKQKAAQLDGFIGKNSICTYKPAPLKNSQERVEQFMAEQNQKFADLQEKVERDIRYLEEKLGGKPAVPSHTLLKQHGNSSHYSMYRRKH